MNVSGKIRLMLAILCATLFFTAAVIHVSYTPANILKQSGEILERNLHQKEKYINDFINDKSHFEELKTLTQSPASAIKCIDYFTGDRSIWFITTRSGQLDFWSGVKVIPQYPASIKNGYSFHKESNGYYEVIKKSEGDFSAIFFIPVKADYSFQNQYLQNKFAADLLTDNNIEIADFTDNNVFEIHSSNHAYLFSVKLKKGEVNLRFFYFELTVWLITLLSFCVLIHNVCSYLAGKKLVYLSIIILATFIVLERYINLYLGWPDFTDKLEIFKPEYYASSRLFPSLGDLCINILFACWFVVFVYGQRKLLLRKPAGKAASYFIVLVCSLILVVVSTSLLNLFNGLVVNSKISFDVTNVLNLSYLSFLGVLMLCFAFLIFFLSTEIFLTAAQNLKIPDRHKLLILILCVLAATVFYSLKTGYTTFYILWCILVVVRGYAYRNNKGKIDSRSLAIVIFICALISAVKLRAFEAVKEQGTRKAFLQELETPDDPAADVIFRRIETQIIADTAIKKYFNDSLHNNNYIRIRLQKLYFNGYLSKYMFDVHEFGRDQQPLSADKSYNLDVFKDMVLYSSYKVSNYFYRENESFGFLSYFAILPLIEHGDLKGTMVIELKSKPIQTAASFPGLLVDGELGNQNQFKGYSYAFYIDNKLLSQSGSYVYDLENTNLKGKLKQYVFKDTKVTNGRWFLLGKRYSHLIYKPSDRTLIVVTKEEDPVYFGLTSLTFFFVVLLLFCVCTVLIRWLWLRVKIFSISNNKLRWAFKANFDLVLYKTRIQFSMVFAVVVTLLLVGIITFLSISTEYETQQDRTIREKITKIVNAFENGVYLKFIGHVNEQKQVEFDDFANTYDADLTLFNLDGTELITTQPKIYDFGLQSRQMNARAFVSMSALKQSEFTRDEKIGLLNYKAAFMPVRNVTGQTLAYLQLPYFSNESDYKERIGSLLNIMINVYAIVFMAIGLFAVFIARQITAPLNFIQMSLSNTIYGKKNEPIKWERNDEIGALVKEYNKMIAALEASAQRLAQSEREIAWREMAKQVAHEIKNPLTPLKLGLQLLDKSWKDKDPKFDQKFERFSKSFVEQIESLSSIASEFSAFAKMPETRLVRLNVFEILNQAVIIFREMDNVKIMYQPPAERFFIMADRDQLLRCFNNLLKNAIEASQNNRPGVIEIKYLLTNKNILLIIKDNGEGIPENLREKIFEPNFTTKSSGTGLGLAFVKNSVENAGGKVWFETRIGDGTSFYISIPIAEEETA